MVNDKQFVIAKKEYNDSGYQTVKLQDGYILSYQPDLSVYVSKGKTQGVLIGLAWQSDSSRKSPYEELERFLLENEEVALSDIYEMERTWCGRYVLIVQSTVILDAAGLLGVFFHEDALSSSYSVLCDIIGIKNKYTDKTFGIGIGYQPGTVTMHDSISRMIPGQSYNYVEHKISYRGLIQSRDVLECTYEQILENFIQYFKTSLMNMQKTLEGEYWLALTGGHDSRTLMALLEYAGISYHCFTLDVESLTDSDRKIPEKLAEITKHKFLFIKRDYRKFSSKKMKEYILHTNGFAKDQDAISYSFGQYQRLTQQSENVVILRGGLWETAVQYYRRFADDNGKLCFERMKKGYKTLNKDKKAVESLRQYFDYIHNYKENYINDIDRFYWEIRGGCWLSSIEQGCDIMEQITFLQPCNSRILLTLLIQLSHAEKEPWRKKHQEDIIRKCCPELFRVDFESAKEKKSVKRTFQEKVCIKIFYHLARIYLYGIRGLLILKGGF